MIPDFKPLVVMAWIGLVVCLLAALGVVGYVGYLLVLGLRQVFA